MNPPYSSRGPWLGLECSIVSHSGTLWTVGGRAATVGVTDRHHAGCSTDQVGLPAGVARVFSAW